VTTAAHLESTSPERAEPVDPVDPALLGRRTVRRAQAQRRSGRARRLAVLLVPALWVLVIIAFSIAFGARMQLAPLLAAAPAIACASTGRRLCVVLGCACALFALVPLPGQPTDLGNRLGAVAAVVIVAAASYLLARRRIRLQLAYDEMRRIADVTQRVLLRPVPERVGPVAAAVEYLSAADGARIGGDLYEVIETPYGVRAILGDVRGNGLDAVSGAAAVLGAFREAGAVEPELESVAVRLDAALARHTAQTPHPEPEGEGAEPGPWTEDFATAVLVQIPSQPRRGEDADADAAAGSDAAGDGGGYSDSDGGLNCDGARLVVCGHPAPYLIRSGEALPLEPECPTLPLGLGSLAAEPYATSSRTVAFGPGDALVLYTDGISDARSRSGEFFPFGEALRGLGGLTPDAMAGLVRSRLLAHTRGALNDDAALLVLRRIGAGAARPDGETPVRSHVAHW
jgi:serine phosphatase RsbU (regulator of sigma subunit)